ncbi:MAG TPA: hemerythrin domain-containing protein [Terriglobia bacterium]|nr:hemerythrin domain-containing protein [Terriglobia bacterium]
MNQSMNRRSRDSNVVESTDPVSMLKEDHRNVKDLFDEFEGTDDERMQMQIAKRAINELKVHAAIEEEIFYPAVREMIDDSEVMSEAREEHHVAHFLLDELENQRLDHDTYHAKFMVLAENVRHHIKEEEGEMLPKIDAEKEELEQIGTRMSRRKQELMENPGVLNRKTNSRASGQTNRSGQARQSTSRSKSGKGSTRTSSKSGTVTSRSNSRSNSKKSGKSASNRSGSRSSSPRASG